MPRALRLLRRMLPFVVALLLTRVALQPAHAQTFTVIHNFSGGPDGGGPGTGTLDAAGNFYGVTGDGGTHQQNCQYGCGTVFKLSQMNGDWILSTLYNFTGGNDGYGPNDGIVFGPDGSLYGTTYHGGAGNYGTVYKLQPSLTFCHSVLCPWTETILHTFAGGTDGTLPSGGIVFDSAGNLYGTTEGGGGSRYCTDNDGCGVVYELTPSGGAWTETLLHTFTGGADGEVPTEGVVFNSAGDLFGACQGGSSPAEYGAVYELVPSGSGWSKSFIYQFTGGSDGYDPNGLIVDSAGTLYGTTSFGGSGGGGTVYDLAPQNGNWLFGLLYPLVQPNPHIYGPLAPLTMDAAGNLYGTSFSGGQYGAGSVFKLTPAGGSWNYASLHDFTGGDDGGGPVSPVVLDSQGNVYGTTRFDGFYGDGVAFKITQ